MSSKDELVRKVSALVKGRFAGDYDRAFRFYATKGTGARDINSEELMELLDDAGVGNTFTRRAWASGIIKELDTSKDSRISWDEFRAVVTNSEG